MKAKQSSKSNGFSTECILNQLRKYQRRPFEVCVLLSWINSSGTLLASRTVTMKHDSKEDGPRTLSIPLCGIPASNTAGEGGRCTCRLDCIVTVREREDRRSLRFTLASGADLVGNSDVLSPENDCLSVTVDDQGILISKTSRDI